MKNGLLKDEKWRVLNGVARWRLCCLPQTHHLKASFPLLSLSHPAPFGLSSLQIENRSTENPKKFLSDLPILDKILFVYGDAEQWF